VSLFQLNAWSSIGESALFDDLLGSIPIRFKEIEMAAKFEVFRGKIGDFRFRLKAANGKVICQGQGYKSKDACLKGIGSIKKNAAGAAVVDTNA